MKPVKILILTESKFFSEALKFMLYDLIEGIDVINSLEDLKKSLKERSYDVIVCDMSYVEKCKEKGIDNIKALAPKTRVLLFSFDPPSKHRDFIKKIGADGYISRPLDPETVLSSVKAFTVDS